MQLKGSVALITGGASGLGAATARYLSSHGVKVSILDRDEEQSQKIAEELSAKAYVVDVTDPASVQAAISQAEECHGIANICINCAGIAPGARIVGREGPMPLEEFTQAVTINLVGSFNVMRLAANAMMSQDLAEDQERGVIINTASIAAFEGQIGQAAYSASKGGLVSLTLPAARELAQHAIRVNTIAPGVMSTPMLEAMPQKVQQSLGEMVPFPKRLGEAQEFAKLVAHIIENSYINGTVIRLDGAVRLAPK